MDLEEGTISASREGWSPDPDLATAAAPWPQLLPSNRPHMASALKLWFGRNQCYGNSSWLWLVLLQPKGRFWVGGLVWESSLAWKGR